MTSSSWDTVTELLALALQSPVPDTMRGSGAGIERLGTYQQIMRLRATEGDGEGRLVLVVDPEQQTSMGPEESRQDTRMRYRTVEIDVDYA